MRTSLLYSVIILFLASPSYAITDRERAVGLRSYHKLELFSLIIDEAAQAANPRDRQHSQYGQLTDDLNKTL